MLTRNDFRCYGAETDEADGMCGACGGTYACEGWLVGVDEGGYKEEMERRTTCCVRSVDV